MHLFREYSRVFMLSAVLFFTCSIIVLAAEAPDLPSDEMCVYILKPAGEAERETLIAPLCIEEEEEEARSFSMTYFAKDTISADDDAVAGKPKSAEPSAEIPPEKAGTEVDNPV